MVSSNGYTSEEFNESTILKAVENIQESQKGIQYYPATAIPNSSSDNERGGILKMILAYVRVH